MAKVRCFREGKRDVWEAVVEPEPDRKSWGFVLVVSIDDEHTKLVDAGGFGSFGAAQSVMRAKCRELLALRKAARVGLN